MAQLKFATWNVNSLKVRLPHVLEWVSIHQPDLLALQETKITDENFPQEEIHQAGYDVIFSGERTYNGMAILTKAPFADTLKDITGYTDPARRILVGTYQGIRAINLYVPNGQEVGSAKFQYKLSWLEAITGFIQQELASYPKLIVLGDFNIAPQPEDVYNPLAWEGRILFSPPEREALQKLMRVGLTDAFRLFPQPEKSYTWWDYRMLGFQRNQGLRIDHILISRPLIEACIDSSIDRAPRKWTRPSDHAPVIAVFNADLLVT